jgi:predicted Zn-ribbon and HTH transcriptional regulator
MKLFKRKITCSSIESHAVPTYRADEGVGLRPLACWDCGFETRRRYGCRSVVSIVCWHVEIPAKG